MSNMRQYKCPTCNGIITSDGKLRCLGIGMYHDEIPMVDIGPQPYNQ